MDKKIIAILRKLFLLNRHHLISLTIISDSPTPYSCYSDGTILIDNPRAELYSYGYAESNGVECPTLYIDGGDKLIVYDCNLVSMIV